MMRLSSARTTGPTRERQQQGEHDHHAFGDREVQEQHGQPPERQPAVSLEQRPPAGPGGPRRRPWSRPGCAPGRTTPRGRAAAARRGGAGAPGSSRPGSPGARAGPRAAAARPAGDGRIAVGRRAIRPEKVSRTAGRMPSGPFFICALREPEVGVRQVRVEGDGRAEVLLGAVRRRPARAGSGPRRAGPARWAPGCGCSARCGSLRISWYAARWPSWSPCAPAFRYALQSASKVLPAGARTARTSMTLSSCAAAAGERRAAREAAATSASRLPAPALTGRVPDRPCAARTGCRRGPASSSGVRLPFVLRSRTSRRPIIPRAPRGPPASAFLVTAGVAQAEQGARLCRRATAAARRGRARRRRRAARTPRARAGALDAGVRGSASAGDTSGSVRAGVALGGEVPAVLDRERLLVFVAHTAGRWLTRKRRRLAIGDPLGRAPDRASAVRLAPAG